jgi:prepilin-type N-terminal cleavage/methylation domain-containing protein
MKRQAFTLPEVLISVALVAILAAVVVPTITSQMQKADPTRMGSEFMAIRGAAEQFVSDVWKFPADIGQLTSVITTSQVALVGTSGGQTYGSSEVARWRGPYLSKDGTAALTTGFGLGFKSVFDTVSLATSGTTPTTGQKYMILAVPMTTNNDTLAILQLDKQFDDGVLLTGSVRYRKCTASPACTGGVTTDTVKFLLLPVH